MSFISGAPTYYGPAPSDFSIAGMTFEDKAVASDSFTISPETGAVSISNTEGMATGTYKPVSDTHLDVYKRQATSRLERFSSRLSLKTSLRCGGISSTHFSTIRSICSIS